GSWECLWSSVAGLRGVGQIAARSRAHLLYRVLPSHRRTISRRSWTKRLATIAFPFSSEKTMIDHLILRLETYPHAAGTRPKLEHGCIRICRPFPFSEALQRVHARSKIRREACVF